MTVDSFMRFNSIACVFTILIASSSHAQTVVYDNISELSFDSLVASGDTRDLAAQQFLLGDATTISRVEVAMNGFGNPSGSITLELWDDDGAGLPGSSAAVIATLSDLIPFGPDVLVFDTDISGLTPNAPYYVVQSFLNATADFENNSVGWALVGPDTGSFGARKALVLSDFFEGQPRPREWREVASDAVGTPVANQVNYFVMKITTIPEPSGFCALALAALISSLSYRGRSGGGRP